MNSAQESTSSITENLKSLEPISKTTAEPTQDANTVDHIINKKITHLEDYLDSKVINIYQRPWNKLELKLKLKKIEQYFREGPVINNDEVNITQKPKKNAKKMIEAFDNYNYAQIKSFCSSNERKKLKVSYDIDLCKITSLMVINS